MRSSAGRQKPTNPVAGSRPCSGFRSFGGCISEWPCGFCDGHSDPRHISLADSTLEQTHVIDVPFVRSRKQVLARASSLMPADCGSGSDLGYARASMIFVVRADAFFRFLPEFEIPDSAYRPFNYIAVRFSACLCRHEARVCNGAGETLMRQYGLDSGLYSRSTLHGSRDAAAYKPAPLPVSIELTHPSASNARMRRPFFQLLILLLGLCVGVQSTASAMGMRCAQAMGSDEAMPAGMHHGGHHAAKMMDTAGTSQHAHHGAGMKSKSPLDTKTGIGSLGCKCGCNCVSAGCTSSGAGIAGMPAAGFFEAAPAAFFVHEHFTGLRSAHGLDLIRPPSKS